MSNCIGGFVRGEELRTKLLKIKMDGLEGSVYGLSVRFEEREELTGVG